MYVTESTSVKCVLNKVPESVTGLKQLYDLNLQGNHGTDLPESFGQLTNLHRLGTAQCGRKHHLKVVPQLSSLRELIMWGNNVKVLEESVCGLQNLQVLDVSNCDLKQFPEFLCRIILLQELNLAWNPITSPNLHTLNYWTCHIVVS